ncbi:hypothetical protein ACWDZ4_05110 [Streptomyces sp. NPDC003016]
MVVAPGAVLLEVHAPRPARLRLGTGRHRRPAPPPCWSARSIAEHTYFSYFNAYAPEDWSMALTSLVKIVGIRRTVEVDFANAKNSFGLDHIQARSTAFGDAMPFSRWPPSLRSP